MKDICSYHNCKTIGNTLKLLHPEYEFSVGARYDPLNFVFEFTVCLQENNSKEKFPFTVYVEDLYENADNLLLIIIMQVDEMIKEMGY